MNELRGKSALVTGASAGIGAATARELASHGVKVVLAARRAAETERLAAELRTTGAEAVAHPADVSRFADVEAAVARCVDAFGGLDIVVNNAGLIDPIARLADSDPDAWGQVVDVNLKGVYHGLRAALPVMLARRRGVVVNISSGAARSALEGWSHYCASKAAAFSLTACAHREYASSGIRIVGLSPGTVATDMQKSIRTSGLNPVSQLAWDDHIPPEWAARAVAWLCTADAADLAGTDFALNDDAGRARVGLPVS